MNVIPVKVLFWMMPQQDYMAGGLSLSVARHSKEIAYSAFFQLAPSPCS
nr:hypothetical protein [uncultured Undibacterium sp.]